jgi:hypothetical protein
VTSEELEAGLASDLDEAKNVLMAVCKNVIIRYAHTKGASAEWCNNLRKYDYFTVVHVVGIIYGIPGDDNE